MDYFLRLAYKSVSAEILATKDFHKFARRAAENWLELIRVWLLDSTDCYVLLYEVSRQKDFQGIFHFPSIFSCIPCWLWCSGSKIWSNRRTEEAPPSPPGGDWPWPTWLYWETQWGILPQDRQEQDRGSLHPGAPPAAWQEYWDSWQSTEEYDWEGITSS